MWINVSDSLKEVLAMQDKRSKAGATAIAAEWEAGRSSAKNALPPTGRSEGVPRPIRLIWTNLNQPAARYVASSLKLVQ